MLIWSLVCLAAIIIIRVYGTADPQKSKAPSWVQVAISAAAYILWIYSLGDVFKFYNLYVPYIGFLLILVWSFFVPLIYKGERP